MPLKLVLRPGERVLVNGALLGAGERTVTLFLHNRVQFLRERELLRAEDAEGALGKFQMAVQALYLAAVPDAAAEREALTRAADEAQRQHPRDAAEIKACAALARTGDGFKALRRCAQLRAALPPP